MKDPGSAVKRGKNIYLGSVLSLSNYSTYEYCGGLVLQCGHHLVGTFVDQAFYLRFDDLRLGGVECFCDEDENVSGCGNRIVAFLVWPARRRRSSGGDASLRR
jgi:hypothetical protein